MSGQKFIVMKDRWGGCDAEPCGVFDERAEAVAAIEALGFVLVPEQEIWNDDAGKMVMWVDVAPLNEIRK